MSDIQITLTDGTIHWESNGIEGKRALWLMADALRDMYRYYFEQPLRPIFNPQAARVCIELVGDKLAIAFRPEEDLASAKALTAAALVALSDFSDAETIDPFEVMFGALTRELEVVPTGSRLVED